MMPDLGPYAGPVIWAYVASIELILVLVLASWRRAVRIRRALEKAEGQSRG